MKRVIKSHLLHLACVVLLVLSPCLAASPPRADAKRTDDGRPVPLSALEGRFAASVREGWRAFQTSYAADGMACADCHLHHREMMGWASAYPKVQVFDGTPYRVKGLREVVWEALTKHTDLSPDRRQEIIEEIVAYISWWGSGSLITPGHSRPLPPAADELETLRQSYFRGENLFLGEGDLGCVECHSSADETISSAARRFPRYVEPLGRVVCLETYLAHHLETLRGETFEVDALRITNILSYLAGLSEGMTYLPGVVQGDRGW